ncbi:MAG: hypothetical protein AB8G95_21520 [Anaerolineae bacterium]
MLRSISAVVAGFFLWTVLWLGSNSLLSIVTPGSYNEDGSTDSALLLMVILLLSVIFSVISGSTTEKILVEEIAWPAWALGIALLAVGLLVQISFWAQFPLWYNILFLVLLIPAVLMGARMAR